MIRFQQLFMLVSTLFLLSVSSLQAQEENKEVTKETKKEKKDSLVVKSNFSGLVGLTSNGLSIIPTFSLNAPAYNILLSVSKNKFSFDPDIRMTLDGRKGSMVFWFRYKAVEGKRYNLGVGAHPAFNIQTRKILDPGTSQLSEISQLRRFIAAEINQGYQVSKNLRVGVYYLKGFGLQGDAVKSSHFLTLNSTISNIKLGGGTSLQFTPQVYYLKLDKEDGIFYTHTMSISKKNVPLLLQSTINKNIKTNINGGDRFQWNITLFYTFNRKYGRNIGEDINRIEDQITDF
jgi:hypothetical protein